MNNKFITSIAAVLTFLVSSTFFTRCSEPHLAEQPQIPSGKYAGFISSVDIVATSVDFLSKTADGKDTLTSKLQDEYFATVNILINDSISFNSMFFKTDSITVAKFFDSRKNSDGHHSQRYSIFDISGDSLLNAIRINPDSLKFLQDSVLKNNSYTHVTPQSIIEQLKPLAKIQNNKPYIKNN